VSPVVHSEHGIGRYQGLLILDLGNGDESFYIFVMLTVLLCMSQFINYILSLRYSGSDPENAPLHNLGSGQWEKAKR
jgi:transcription-repair coupling factor (superfamily II helicase)